MKIDDGIESRIARQMQSEALLYATNVLEDHAICNSVKTSARAQLISKGKSFSQLPALIWKCGEIRRMSNAFYYD